MQMEYQIIPEDISIPRQLKMLFLPDLTEFLLMGVGLAINLLILPEIFGADLFLGSINQYNLTSLGIIYLIFFGYRWGYSSLGEAIEKRKKAEKRHAEGEALLIEIKLLGLVFGLFFFLSGLFFIDTFIYITSPIIELITILF